MTPEEEMVVGLDYVITGVSSSDDVVDVPLGKGDRRRRREKQDELQDFNRFMSWMKRSDRALYDDILRK
jgi:hypothetical protein